MLDMKRLIVAVSLLFVSFCVVAQSDDYSYYLDKAKKKLSAGECKDALRNYNYYRKLAHDSLPQLYGQIQACIDAETQQNRRVETVIAMDPLMEQLSTENTEKAPEETEKAIAETEKARKENGKAENDAKRVKEPKKENKFKNYLKDRNNPYCEEGRNRYIAWTFLCAGYPWNVTMGVELRGGGRLGIGAYADVGVDVSRFKLKKSYVDAGNNLVSDKFVEVKAQFRYVGGIRLYYKGLFISAGYGSIAKLQPATLEYDSWEGYQENYEDDLLKIIRGHGIHLNIGYNGVLMCGNNGPLYGISLGVAYDVVNKVFYPSVGVKLGWAFDWKKY